MKKTLIAGILACILLGLVIGSASAGRSAAVDDSPMTIPIGRVEDTFEYAILVREGNATEWTEGGLNRWDVMDLRRSVDKMAGQHEALRVRSAGLDLAGVPFDVFLDVDLDTREVLRHELELAVAASGYTVANKQVRYGPGLMVGYWNETFQPFAHQGSTLSLHDSLDTSSIRDYYAHRLGATDLAISWRITDRATIDGREAYAATLHLSGWLLYREHFAEYFSTVEKIHEEVGNFSARFDITVTTWLSDAVPYPVLVETKEQYEPNVTGPLSKETQHVLSHFEPGLREIPWADNEGEYRDWNLDIARGTQPTLYPQDGVGSTIAYPLSQAVAAVEGDLTLRAFQEWRAAHPDSAPVFATYRDFPDADAVSHPRWVLIWSDAKSTFTINSERRGAFPVSVNSELGQGDGGVGSDEPRTYVTWAGAEAAWRSQAGEQYRTLPVNTANWVGDSFDVGVWDRQTVPSASANISSLILDAESGEYGIFTEYGFAFGAPIFIGGVHTPPLAARQHAAAAIGLQPPDIERTTIASLSLLAIFLAVYFFPLLKYAAAQGVWIVPGYAKVRKEALLDHRIRDHIMQVVREDPGINASEIQRKAGVGWGTIVHHLNKLEENRLVSSIIDGRQRCFFPVGIVDFSRRGQMTVLRNERTNTIYSMIADEPGLVQGAIASRVGVSVPSAIWHLRRLEEAGLVGRDRQGRHVHYYPADPEPRQGKYDAKDAVEVA